MDRILTTHVGSLLRPEALKADLIAQASGEPYDDEAFQSRLRADVAEVVKSQVALIPPGLAGRIPRGPSGLDPVAGGEIDLFKEMYRWVSFVVAQRLVRLANLVGRDSVMAGTDCGFAQSSYIARTDSWTQWAKLRSLVEGAQLASRRLWGRS